MTKKELTIIFMEAKANKCDVCVEVTIPGQEDTEYIVNKNRSIDNKLDYYFQTYDDNSYIKIYCKSINYTSCCIMFMY